MKFHIHAEVEQADGYTTFEVDADNKEHALKLFNEGEGIYVDEEVNVTSYRNLTLDDVEEIGTGKE